uniref:Uncharacterized protein n=1 Tax=Chlamydomonas euryale TaxID=1486919 RepID=A0A7R9VYK5_9CHLO
MSLSSRGAGDATGKVSRPMCTMSLHLDAISLPVRKRPSTLRCCHAQRELARIGGGRLSLSSCTVWGGRGMGFCQGAMQTRPMRACATFVNTPRGGGHGKHIVDIGNSQATSPPVQLTSWQFLFKAFKAFQTCFCF